MINKILFITLSNIGDAILSLPSLDLLRQRLPEAKITVMCGARTKEIFDNGPGVSQVIVYHKGMTVRDNIKLFFNLRVEKFDLIVDLRNTFFGVLLSAPFKTSPFTRLPGNVMHMKDRHLFRTAAALNKIKLSNVVEPVSRDSFPAASADEDFVKKLLLQKGVGTDNKIVIISAGARSHIKRWMQDEFTELVSLLVEEFKLRVILVGDKEDTAISGYIAHHARVALCDLTGLTNIPQLAVLIKRSACVITNDSAVLHLSSYLDVPTIALFGPTDELKYGPWSKVNAIVKKDIYCRPCSTAQCKLGTLSCMQFVKVEDVIGKVRNILVASPKLPACPASRQVTSKAEEFRRILIVRTDRIGDVVLSTPVIKALRENYPQSYIAMMVSPYSREVVQDNPYLDEVIVYDKDVLHKSWLSSVLFSRELKKKKFDLTLILHPINRVHLITFLAGITRRVGYDRKLGFLLTDRLAHAKQFGEKHELEYNLDLLAYLGIIVSDLSTFMPIKKESEEWAREVLSSEGVVETDKLLVINPGASCPSKIWPNQRFAEVADKLVDKYDLKVAIVSGPKDMAVAEAIINKMKHRAINLSGKSSVSQLASIIKRCALFISNDSGPVHLASALGTPVISIFGRNQPGLSPRRWGPVGGRDKALHKEVGCIECLAHNCRKEFACLKAVCVDDVVNAADSILEEKR